MGFYQLLAFKSFALSDEIVDRSMDFFQIQVVNLSRGVDFRQKENGNKKNKEIFLGKKGDFDRFLEYDDG